MKPTEEHQQPVFPATPQPPAIASQPQQPQQLSHTEQPMNHDFDTDETIKWEASEFIDHQKNAGWFLLLSLGGIVLCVAVYFLLRDILATVVTGVAILTFGMFARKKPRTLTYMLTPTYFMVGERRYSYDDFRTFSVIQDGALYSILLAPNQRFMPPLTIYFDPEDGEDIFDVLAERIPHEERKADPIDRFMRRIRF
jgi:membrane protein CcdC involved in cytochrome C biogenesis